MLEDEQRFEELEAKLAALSSQVEGLELEKEVDPFFEDDVRRLIEDFREKEVAQLEESEDFEDSDDSVSGNDFIDVQTTGGRTFKVHWISPESCDNMTKATARAAFAAGAAERYGTSQQVNSGDVLILLCRKPIPEEPESGSETSTPLPPEKFCHYIGMAVNTGLSPTSAEPPATDVESMTSTVGNYEIFVWSSCECSAESSEPITITALTPDSSSSASDPYAKVGSEGSFISESVDGLLTGLEVKNTEEQAPLEPLDSVVLKDEELTEKEAGFRAKLISLSEKLTDYYVNYSSKSLSFDASTKNIDTLNFDSDSFLSKTLELTGSECGGLQSVSLGSNSLELIKAGSSVSSSTPFVNSAKVSLGVSIYKDGTIDGTNFIPSYRAEIVDDIEHPGDKKVFLPIVSEANSNLILPEANLASLLQDNDITIEAHYNVVYEDLGLGDAEYWIYQKKTNQKQLSWASGLLTSAGTEETLSRELVGIIRTSDAPLAYGCHPENGCQLDPAGEYYEPSCGGNCAQDELVLTYRPSVIYVYEYDSESNCYNLISEHIRDDGNALNDLANQYYTQNGRYSAELDAAQEKTENFYKSDVLITEGVRFSPVADEDICTSLDTVLADFSESYDDRAIVHTREVNFEKTTADTDISIRFNPLSIPDKITLWYVKDGVETKLLDGLELSTANKDGANDSGGTYLDFGAADTSGFLWTKTVPAGAVSLTIEIDGTVSRDPMTKWYYTIASF